MPLHQPPVFQLFRQLRRAFVPLAVLVLVATATPAAARNQTSGFSRDELTAAAGSGPDPGTRDPAARLKWAVETAIPTQWRETVRVVWTVGDVGSGHLALSYLDGRTVLSPRVMSRSAEEVLFTVAHEMGHQIAFALVSPVTGMPPQGFIEIAPPYADVREGWADCVARAWTGSSLYTLSEAGPCNTKLAVYVAGLVADPATLGATVRIAPPPIRVAPPPIRVAPPSPAPSEPVPEPPPTGATIQPETAPRRTEARPAAQAPTPSGSDGLALALGLIPVPFLVCAAGYWLVSRRNPRLLAWAAATPQVKQSHRRGQSRG